MSKMSELHASFGVYLDLVSANERAVSLRRFAVLKPPKFNPRSKLKPLAAKLLAVSNGLSLRVDSLKKIQGCLT